MTAAVKFSVFGRPVLVMRADGRWQVYHLGGDGKRRPAPELVVPPDVEASKVQQYLGDLCHEWATANNPHLIRLA